MRERNHFVGLWLNDEEYSHMREQCEITGLPASVLIRHTLAGVQLRQRPPGEYAALLRVLSSIGNNVNQKVSHGETLLFGRLFHDPSCGIKHQLLHSL